MSSVMDYFISKFEDEYVSGFVSNIEEHIQENYEMIDEWLEQGVDEKSIECQEEYIHDIMYKHKLYKGFMTYGEVKEVLSYYDKKGISCQNIFGRVEFKKVNLEELKRLIWEEWVESDEECEMIENITTMKELRAFLKDEPMGSDWVIINGYFINSVTY